ncbi:hypothetical protein A3A25_03560 [Candidatus Azambacteria bacterium RIFCSPLOWO2_01_FULL_46_26]|uniref:Prepilin-type N-terminal cleavage/methylation domain-containing protein n=2 Tax=Candidatus Azamiibacteriota TaxID=1752741 RepID=A0A1F5C5X2_9BACT|nr:MAG: hypothetical protein A2W60_00945 [Candidatus Azambacteria bacterium RIFCSPHIGHO2_02_46_12]OGD38241.1 MAG: hypothetical protein A3A25_03560 [Candidatus Azambacteria bacterium RIFCSPLOWO2_01_FULL_46_26]
MLRRLAESSLGRLAITSYFMKKNKNQKGFTLIELLVSVSLFAIFVTIATGLFLSSIQGQRKVFSFQAVQDNSRYVTEFMAREMRMGKNFLVSGGNTLTFTNQKNETVIYCLVSNNIKRAVGAVCDANSSNLTSSEVVVVDKLEFLLSGGDVGDLKQPRITIVMKLHSSGTVSAVETSLNLQTTVSARKLES